MKLSEKKNVTNEPFSEHIKADHKHDMKYDQIKKHINNQNLDKNDHDMLIIKILYPINGKTNI